MTTILAALGILLPNPADGAPLFTFFSPLLGALFLLALGGLLFHVDQPIGLILLLAYGFSLLTTILRAA